MAQHAAPRQRRGKRRLLVLIGAPLALLACGIAAALFLHHKSIDGQAQSGAFDVDYLNASVAGKSNPSSTGSASTTPNTLTLDAAGLYPGDSITYAVTLQANNANTAGGRVQSVTLSSAAQAAGYTLRLDGNPVGTDSCGVQTPAGSQPAVFMTLRLDPGADADGAAVSLAGTTLDIVSPASDYSAAACH